MEAGESGARHSSTGSANHPNHDRFGHRQRESFDRPYRDSSTMATAALISPTTPYNPHHAHSFSSGYHPGPGPSIPGMISPAESRRTSDDNDATHRRSLPSIQEVIGQKPSAFQTSIPTPMSAAQSLPSPFSTSTPTRPFSDPGTDKHPSPRTRHPTSTFPRPESMPAFSDPARPPLAPRVQGPPPPLSFAGPPPPPPPPPAKMQLQLQPQPPPQHPSQHPPPQQGAEPRQGESQRPNGAYPHQAPPQPHVPPQPSYTAPGQLPPGQLPLSGPYPVSPRHGGPSLPSPYEPQRPPPHHEEAELRDGGGKYEATLSRHFEAWNYAENLSRIGTCARTLFNFAEAYGTVAREEHGAHPIAQRLPTEREISDMITNVDYTRSLLEHVRGVVQQSIINERAREGTRPKGSFDDEDVQMYGDGAKTGSYNAAEVKKRRGRAAPPGRCHSCNRIDTPEWRRGPDGARTLCNACGLHYAKLERKRNASAAQSIRPKPSEERS